MLLIIAAVSCYVLHIVKPELVAPVVIERIQLIVFPLILISISTLRSPLFKVPRAVLFVTAFAALVALSTTYHVTTVETGPGIIVGRLTDDEDESQTRKLREGVEAIYKGRKFDVSRYYKSFTTDAEARQLFLNRPDLRGVLWGSKRWLNISFPYQAPIEISTLNEIDTSSRVSKLQIVRGIKVIGLSGPAQKVTREFVANLFDDVSIGELSTIEGLESALQIGGAWVSRSHKAYAAWRLGNEYLILFLKGGGKEAGILSCAKASYELANNILTWGQNPELAAAILNNYGVLKAIESESIGDPKLVREAHRYIRAAGGTREQPDPYKIESGALKVALQNLKILRSDLRGDLDD